MDIRAFLLGILVVFWGVALRPLQSQGQNAGSLDPSFGTGGKSLTAFSQAYADAAYTIAQQADGKTVVAGGGATGLRLARYNANGTLDASFGAGGTVSSNLGPSPPSSYYPTGYDAPAFALDILIQPTDGKIVAVGRRGYQFLLIRYNPDGTLDTGFGFNGFVVSAVQGLGNAAHKVLLDSSGRLLVLVTASSLGPLVGVVLRYSSVGVLDTSYTTLLGQQLPANSGDFTPVTAILDPADNLVIAGYSSPRGASAAQNGFPAVLRLLSNGNADLSFGNQGLAIWPNTVPIRAAGIARQGDGKLVVSVDDALWRLTANGATDVAFGVAGTVSFAGTVLHKPVIQADGQIVAVGMRRLALGSDFTAVRVSNTGVPDATFGSNGHLLFSAGRHDVLYDAVLQPDGKIVAAGSTSPYLLPQAPIVWNMPTDSSRFAVYRILTRIALATQSQANKPATLTAYPNPVSRSLHIEMADLPTGNSPLQLHLYNNLGQVVHNMTLIRQGNPATTIIDVSGLKAGVYWLRGGIVGQKFTLGKQVVVE